MRVSIGVPRQHVSMKPSIIHRPAEAAVNRPPLLLVHGAFSGAWCWQEHFMPFFCDRGYECLALDFRGHGNGTPSPCLHTVGISDYVRDLAWALQQCSQPPVVIAHSMGGFVAIKLLQQQMPQLAGLVLLSPASPRHHFESAMKMYQYFPLLCLKLNMMNSIPKSFWPWIISPAEVRRLLLSDANSLDTPARVLLKMQPESLLAMIEMLRLDFSHPPRLPFPAIVMCGCRDAIVAPDITRRTAKWLDSDLHVEPEMGHAMMLEDGWQTAAEFLMGWLDGNVSC
jgi:pimeloyl-ACP methyl ester carboxylesterase